MEKVLVVPANIILRKAGRHSGEAQQRKSLSQLRYHGAVLAAGGHGAQKLGPAHRRNPGNPAGAVCPEHPGLPGGGN